MLNAGSSSGYSFDDAHEDTSLGPIALGFDSHQRHESVEGTLGPYDGITRGLAEAREGVQAFDATDKQVDIMKGEVGHESVVERCPNALVFLVRVEAVGQRRLDKCLVGLGVGAEFADDVERRDDLIPVLRRSATDYRREEGVGEAVR